MIESETRRGSRVRVTRSVRESRVIEPRADSLVELGSLKREELLAVQRALEEASRPASGTWLAPMGNTLVGAALGAMLSPSPLWIPIAAFLGLGIGLLVAHRVRQLARTAATKHAKALVDAILARYEPEAADDWPTWSPRTRAKPRRRGY